MVKKFLLTAIRFYQKHLSWDTGIFRTLFLTDKACRYNPSCSEYTRQAIEKYGAARGAFLGLRRIASCHPFSKGGSDPLPE